MSRGLQLIPHLGFWMDYPNLVMDGVKYATQLGPFHTWKAVDPRMAKQYSGREAPSFLDSGGQEPRGNVFHIVVL